VARGHVLDAEVVAVRRAAVLRVHRLKVVEVVVSVPAGRPVADELRRVGSRW